MCNYGKCQKYHFERRDRLGIEFGSTRIKSVLVDLNGSPLASGSFDWENSYKNGVWTYSLDEVFEGLRLLSPPSKRAFTTNTA